MTQEQKDRLETESTKIDPNYVDAWYDKGRTLLGSRDYYEAAEAYDEIVKLNSSDEVA